MHWLQSDKKKFGSKIELEGAMHLWDTSLRGKL